jgi:glycosyltransferase involved in cell wall biosynthesis
VKFFTDNFNRTLNSVLIAVPSHSTKQDLINDFGVPAEKIQVVPHGRNEFYQPIHKFVAQSITKKHVDKPFILFSGVIEPRKNLTNLLLAFVQIRKRRDVALVLAGDFGWQHEPIVHLPRKLGLRDVYFTGSIPAEDLRGLYNGAEVFVYPSLYEGFGFPPLEAMACGLPTVLSNVSSLPEVGGEAAMYVDPQAVESITEGTLRVLEDTQLRQLMSRRGIERSKEFSWDTTATQMITLYEDVIRKV